MKNKWILSHLDLFSGIGGFALAARWAGYQTIAFCEIEPYAQKVLIKNFDAVLSDPKCDGGYGQREPQPAAGETGGVMADAKSGKSGQPKTGNGRKGSGRGGSPLFPDIRLLHVIPACAVGAFHRRDRVWIVCHTKYDGHITRKIRKGDYTGKACANPLSSGREEQRWTQSSREEHAAPEFGCRWEPEPAMGRVVNGLPHRVDRLRGLGNAIVPQVAYQILRPPSPSPASPLGGVGSFRPFPTGDGVVSP